MDLILLDTFIQKNISTYNFGVLDISYWVRASIDIL